MADFDACLAMNRDPEVTKFIPGPWNDPNAHEAFLRQRIQATYGRGLGYWSIFPKDDPDAFLGWILLTSEDAEEPDIEIGWRLKRSAWGKGYATEAAMPVLDHAFRTLGLDRVIADINPHNAASIRVAEKIGMTPLQAGRMVVSASAGGNGRTKWRRT
jgi:RimJ/RimL family protein N-acetyltransferase